MLSQVKNFFGSYEMAMESTGEGILFKNLSNLHTSTRTLKQYNKIINIFPIFISSYISFRNDLVRAIFINTLYGTVGCVCVYPVIKWTLI